MFIRPYGWSCLRANGYSCGRARAMNKNVKLAIVFVCVAVAFYFDMRHRMGELGVEGAEPRVVDEMPYAANTSLLKVRASR